MVSGCLQLETNCVAALLLSLEISGTRRPSCRSSEQTVLYVAFAVELLDGRVFRQLRVFGEGAIRSTGRFKTTPGAMVAAHSPDRGFLARSLV